MTTTKKPRSKKQNRRSRSNRPVKGRKSKKRLRREARLEVEKVYNDFKSKMKKLKGGTVGMIYARFSSRFQDSIGSQVRALLDFAVREKIYVPLENILYDVAERGSKRNREGLAQAEQLLKSKQAKVLLVFKTNRLFRKAYRCLEFIDRAVKSWGSRLVFVKDHLDSRDPDFHGIKLQILAMLDEHGSKVHIENVVAQHILLATQNIITCTVTFGFKGVEMEGQTTRRGLPRRQWAICDHEAAYVRLIFRWFVVDGLSIAEIVRRLNQDPDAPLTPRSGGTWTRLAVKILLTNKRYLGIFQYGEKQNTELVDCDYIVRRKRDEALFVITVDDLRIVKPKIWFEAQDILEEKRSRGGRRKGRSSKPTGSEIIRGLFECPKHECKTWISGDAIYCPGCQKEPREQRCLVSKLPTEIATQLLLKAVTELILQDESFVADTHSAYVKELDGFKYLDPKEVQRLRFQSDDLGRRIQAIKLDKGESETEVAESEQLLRVLRAERQEAIFRIAEIEGMPKVVTPPTLDETRARLESLGNNFLDSSGGRDPVVLGRLSRALRLLTGGEITLYQCGSHEPRKGWLRAEFDICLGAVLSSDESMVLDDTSLPTRHVVVEFKRPCPFEDEANEAYRLDTEECIPRKEIGTRLGCSKSKVTKLLKHAYAERGEEYVDGRARRGQMNNSPPPVYDRINDRVMELYNDDWLLQSIADDVEVCKDTITQVVRICMSGNDLPLEDGRTRRKRLAVKNRPVNHICFSPKITKESVVAARRPRTSLFFTYQTSVGH